MSSRWRERKATLVSSTELQARRKALLAPVQRYRRGWVQLRADSAYKVLKWVPRDMTIGTMSTMGQLVGFFEEVDEIDASTDDEEEDEDEGDEPEGAGSEMGAVGSKRGRSTGEGEEAIDLSSAKSHKGLKMERKTSKAVEDTERVGGQLAGLETGQIAEQIEIEDDEDEEEQVPIDQEPQTQQTVLMDEDEDEDGREQPANLAPYSQPEDPAPLTDTPTILLPSEGPSDNALPADHVSGLGITVDLQLPSYSTTDRQPTPDAMADTPQPILTNFYSAPVPELIVETDQGIPVPLTNNNTLGVDLPILEQSSIQDHSQLTDPVSSENDTPAIANSDPVSRAEESTIDASMT
ncbi:hypothetical protein MJO29_009410 [Puccinia striiformis f. sp. tritici]|uniref:hypothetical protein n=1 Tax=Puccinia striiformis f. sp. tritici TaxID=168172 RepID=UPI002008950B|nr:hypothetical protein Pst134EA_017526 [Puccinia striiformis f. sp. tritici]KAH9461217.1 hypothetical protein Pst134EA_017526 [Puccinia striiformis f. sp. tritici]KAI7950736.1 hypothetical protein MJO29_009410 [Puccinia striiformis f. sp. tritici]KAI9607297.1 hypothetical protein H4Q26_005814 [Puccinia striiformis f. sp. tritici PST-130]